MRLDEISRRGFLGTGVAAAASTVIPSEDLMGFIETFTKDVGGSKNLKVLAELMKKFDAYDLERFYGYISGDTSFPEVLTDDEADDLADKIASSPGYVNDYDDEESDNFSAIHQWVEDGEFEGDISEAASELIGREIQYLQALEIVDKNGLDPYEFFDYHDGVGETIKNAYMDALKKYSSNITPANLVSSVKSAGLPLQWVRGATTIASLIQKVIGKTSSTQVPPTPATQQDAPTQTSAPAALPAPSDSPDIGLSNIDRMKDLAGIKRNNGH